MWHKPLMHIISVAGLRWGMEWWYLVWKTCYQRDLTDLQHDSEKRAICWRQSLRIIGCEVTRDVTCPHKTWYLAHIFSTRHSLRCWYISRSKNSKLVHVYFPVTCPHNTWYLAHVFSTRHSLRCWYISQSKTANLCMYTSLWHVLTIRDI